MLEYQLGEMLGTDGSVLRYEIEARAFELAIRISRIIESTSIYKQLIRKLPSQRVLLYFQYIIKKEIYPFVRQGCVIQWYKSNGKTIPFHESVVKVPKSGVFILLKECWNFEDIPITLVSQLLLNFTNVASLQKLIKYYAKTSMVKLGNDFYRFKKNNYPTLPRLQQGTIACHYTEGIDPFRRNDLNWFWGSGISPKQVLIYLDSNNIDNSQGNKVRKETVQQIEKHGFRWVALDNNIIERKNGNYWQPPKVPDNFFIDRKEAQNKVETWIVSTTNNLLEQVHYWRSFYNEFDIRINYTSEEGLAKNIAQSIAFDIEEAKPGLLIGKQRSEIFLPHSLYCIGYHPKHIFFVWNKRLGHYFSPNYNQNEVFVIAGYPNCIVRKDENISNFRSDFSQKLKSKGIGFIIALFDNMYGPDIHFSKKGMIEFYQSILQWILDDPTVGLIIKSKKPFVINNLPEIHSLLNRALKTDRCIRRENEFGRFPSEASFGADMAIGCGISSALIEAVIGGCRGIHCDMTNLKSHEFYKWGYEKLIFDNLDRMIESLKKYKENPQNNSELGNWSPYLNKLDPFRDGKGGERMGSYMCWLLESFDNGKNRNEAIQYANKLYSEQWGSDKIIPMSELA